MHMEFRIRGGTGRRGYVLGNKRLRLFLSFAVFAIVLCTSVVMVSPLKTVEVSVSIPTRN